MKTKKERREKNRRQKGKRETGQREESEQKREEEEKRAREAREEARAEEKKEELRPRKGTEEKKRRQRKRIALKPKRETNSMHEEDDVSNRHMTWWKNAWWIRVDGGPHTHADGARRAARRAAEQAREDDRVEETQSFPEETEGEKWEKERQNKQCSEDTLHKVLHLPSNANATATATSATARTTTTAAATAAGSAIMRLQWPADKVVEKMTTSDLKLKETVTKEELLFYDINVNDFLTKFKSDNVYGCRRHQRRHHRVCGIFLSPALFGAFCVRADITGARGKRPTR